MWNGRDGVFCFHVHEMDFGLAKGCWGRGLSKGTGLYVEFPLCGANYAEDMMGGNSGHSVQIMLTNHECSKRGKGGVT